MRRRRMYAKFEIKRTGLASAGSHSEYRVKWIESHNGCDIYGVSIGQTTCVQWAQCALHLARPGQMDRRIAACVQRIIVYNYFTYLHSN